jgi:hypothetical protein
MEAKLLHRLSDVFHSDKAATSGSITVNHDNRVGKHPRISDHGTIASFRDACHQSHDQRGVRLVHLGADKSDALLVGLVVRPDINPLRTGAPECDRIICSPLAGESRYERRSAYRSKHDQELPALMAHLGIFEGERKQNSKGFSEPDSIPKALTSLVSITAALFVVAMLVGAL